LRGQLMLALYRSGRQAEALDLYRQTRETLVDELGIEPSRELQELERSILRQDRSLQPGRRPPEPDEGHAPRPRRRRLLVLILVLALAAVAAGAAALAFTGSGSSRKGDAELRTFVSKAENLLVQSREGRLEASDVVGMAFGCKLTPQVAVVRLNRVQRNRQSVLDQVAALSVPNDASALQASDLLQKAMHASITADWHYRDSLLGRTRCGRPANSPDLREAQRADAQATRTKRSFVVVFDPLARRFGQRTWTAAEF